MKKLLHPDAYYPSLLEVDLEKLKTKGIKGLFIDLDNTLVGRGEWDISPEAFAWLEGAKKDFKCCLVSNNFLTSKHFAQKLGLPNTRNFLGKPFKRPFAMAKREIGLPKKEIAMVGDQIFTDVLGGNCFGIYTILVSPQSHNDPFHTKFLRRLEKKIIRHLSF